MIFPADWAFLNFCFLACIIWRQFISCCLDSGSEYLTKTENPHFPYRVGAKYKWRLLAPSFHVHVTAFVVLKEQRNLKNIIFNNSHYTVCTDRYGEACFICCYVNVPAYQFFSPRNVVKHHFSSRTIHHPLSKAKHIHSSFITHFEQRFMKAIRLQRP